MPLSASACRKSFASSFSPRKALWIWTALVTLAVFPRAGAHAQSAPEPQTTPAPTGIFLADPAIPVLTSPTTNSSYFVLNQDSTVLVHSTSEPGYNYACASPSGFSTGGQAPVLVNDNQNVYLIGHGAGGKNSVISAIRPGFQCTSTPAIQLPGGVPTQTFSSNDPYHARLFVLSAFNGNGPDQLVVVDDLNNSTVSQSNQLTQGTPKTLDTGAQYTSVVTDVLSGYGLTAITEMATSTSAGNLLVYDPGIQTVFKILGPGGVPLPAIGSFIIPSPVDSGGGLLVLVNQDGLNATTISNPPQDTTPFTIIDLGQLHAAFSGVVSQGTTVTLPTLTRVNATFPFFAMLGAVYNPVDRMFYALVGGGNASGVTANVVRYDLSTPGAPKETVVADVSTIPFSFGVLPQLALNAAAPSLQIFLPDSKSLYTIGIGGNGNTAAVPVTGTTFPDKNFLPTSITSNPLLGETYIASAGGQVDILTSTSKRATLTIRGDDIAVVNQSYSLSGLAALPAFDTALYAAPVTVTATPASGGAAFTFATSTVGSQSYPGGYFSGGTFPSTGVYTLQASVPATANFPAFSSNAVSVTVAKNFLAGVYPTTLTLSVPASSPTGAVNALLTLKGSTYAPTGRIIVNDATGAQVGRYDFTGGAAPSPISLLLTVPQGSSTLTAAYNGDGQNGASTSAPATVVVGSQLMPVLSLQVAGSESAGSTQSGVVTFTSSPASATVPTGNVLIYALPPRSTTPIVLATVPAGTAFAAGGANFTFVAPAAGSYTIFASYPGDGNYSVGASPNTAVTVVSGAATTLTISAPANATNNANFDIRLSFSPNANTPAPTGNVIVTATPTAGGTSTTLLTYPASFFVGKVGLSGGATIPQPGTYTLTTSYAGDATYAPSTASTSITITTGSTNTTYLNLDVPTNQTVGSTIQATVYITANNASNPITGDIVVTLTSANGVTRVVGTIPAAQAYGLARIPVPFTVSVAGNYGLEAVYAGDANYRAANAFQSFTATGQGTTIGLIAPATVMSTVSFNAQVTLNSTSTTVPTGNIILGATAAIAGATSTTVATIPAASAFTPGGTTVPVKINLPAGQYFLAANYAGDSNYGPSTNTVNVTVQPAPQVPVSLTLTGPPTGQKALTAQFQLKFTPTTGSAPTGNITLAAVSGSSTQTLAPVPAALAFAAAGATVNFTPSSAGTYTITASYAGDAGYTSASASASLVVAGSTNSLTIRPPTQIVAGQSFTAGIFFISNDTSIPSGNVTVIAKDAASNTYALGSVAASQAYQGGANVSGTLPAAGSYTLTASYAGDSNYAPAMGSATVTVIAPSPGLGQLSPTSLYFSTAVGTTSPLQSVTLTNIGNQPLTISNIQTTDPSFTQINGCGATLAGGASCVIRVSFTPGAPGNVPASLVVTNGGGSPLTVALTGVGLGPTASLDANLITFPSLTVGTSAVTPYSVNLRNSGAGSLKVIGVTLDNTTDFEITANTCTPGTQLSGTTTCKVTVTSHPSVRGPKTATLQIATNAANSPNAVTVNGYGLATLECLDSDGDGLCDDWETSGVNVRVPGMPDQFIDLPAMGADPMHKDIFVQTDYMADTTPSTGHTHQLLPAALAILIQSFQDAPVMNPDKTTGIHFHVDGGAAYIMNPVTKATWGMLSRATQLPELAALDTVNLASSGNFDWTVFDSDSAAFLKTGRTLIFHHMIMGHLQQAGNFSSGISRNPSANFFQGASDLVMTLGGAKNPRGTATQQAGTLMHELGHNLGLAHGGQDQDNRKPNYLSIMNYNFQFTGLTINNAPGTYDYSRFSLPDLNENNLDETVGLNADPATYPGTSNPSFPAIDKYGTSWFCPGTFPNASSPVSSPTVNGNVNWNCDVTTDTPPQPIYSPKVRSNLNADTITINKINYNSFTKLKGYEDWSKLSYIGGSIGGSGAGTQPPAQTVSNEQTIDAAEATIPAYRVEVHGMGIVQTAPGSAITLRFQIQNSGATADTYKLTASSKLGWTSGSLSASSIALAPGATAELTLSYIVPAGTANGTTDRITVDAVSQTSARILDSKEVLAVASSTPAPLSFSVSNVVFALQTLGSASTPTPLVVLNTGTAPLALGTLTLSAQFTQTNTCPATLATGASCVINLTFTPSAVGLQTGTLTVTPGGAVASFSVALSGNALAAPLPRPRITLTIAPVRSTVGQPLVFTAMVAAQSGAVIPTGSVVFSTDTTTLGPATVDASGKATLSLATLAAGTYSVTADYSGDTSFLPLTAPFQTVTVSAIKATSVTLTSSAGTVTPGTAVTFTAAVSGGSGTIQPTGSIRFVDGSTTLGTGTLNASGQATYTTSALTTGSHSITAAYAGDTAFGAATSAPFVQVVMAPPDYMVGASPASLTVARGSSGSATFTVTPVNGYAGTVTLSCLGLPADASCSFAPSALTFTAATQTAQTSVLTVGTRLQARMTPGAQPSTRFPTYVALTIWPISLLSLLGLRRRKSFKALRGLLMVAMTLSGMTLLGGCGSSAATTQNTPAGTYNLTINLTDGTTTHTVNYPVVVQ